MSERTHVQDVLVCRDLTGAQLFSVYNKAKGKRAFTSFRFRNRSEAQLSGFQSLRKSGPKLISAKHCFILLLSENPKGMQHVMVKLEEQKRWMQVPLPPHMMVTITKNQNPVLDNVRIHANFPWDSYSLRLGGDIDKHIYDSDMQMLMIYQQLLAAPSLSSLFLWPPPLRFLQPLNLLGPEALQELTTLKGGYKQANKT